MRAHIKYLSYVIRHKWFVFQAGLKTGAPLWRLIIHDWSKLLPCEWFPYVANFYGRFSVGAFVDIRDAEGVWGEAQIVASRAGDGRFQVQMCDGSQTFWAWDYEIDGLQPMLRDFDRAWLHHQHTNPHHWQHWVLREDSGSTKVLQMPDHFVREMVADWMGAGRAITGQWGAADWYKKNEEKIMLHPATKASVLDLLGLTGERR